jgi:L,D-transpeptidase catalytic domain
MRAFALGVVAIPLASLLAPAPADARSVRYSRERPETPDTKPVRMPDGPINIVISIGSQRLWVYDRRGLLETSMVSTGTSGYPTPTGVFAILDKEVTHYSNIYGGASMPFMQRLTMSGVALHSGVTTGRPASHGCIRLPHAFAIKLFRLTSLGARVIIAPNEPAPAAIEHAGLFVRKPAPPVAAQDIDTARAAVVAAAIGFDLQKATGDARVGKITAWRAGVLQAMPISVFVSKTEGKVFVRHGFRTLFEAPATIRNPEQPLGTHVFTASELKDDGMAMSWWVVSVPPSQQPAVASRKVSRASRIESEPLLPAADGPPSTAAEALDRIELPPEARERISQLIAPGSTLIVSDHGHNREMRENGTTDFIVLTR